MPNEFERQLSRSDTGKFVFNAYSIFWKWPNTGLITPAYIQIEGGFPWFKTKREAKEFLRKVKPRRKKDEANCLEWQIRPVVLEMKYDRQ